MVLKKVISELKVVHLSSPNPEPEFIALLIKKDHIAFNYLYDQYAGALYGVILKSAADAASAEEILAVVFKRIVDEVALYDRSRCRFFTWMIIIARNTTLSYSTESR